VNPLLHQLERDGYAVVRSLLPASETEHLGAAFDRLVERARQLPGPTDVDQARFVLQADPFRLHRVVWCGGADAELARYGDDPRFLHLATAALRADPVVQLVQQAHFKLPGDRVVFPWHQDASNRRYGTPEWTDVDGRGSFLQIAVAVDPMGPDNGGLRVLPGTHRLGFVAEVGSGALPAGLINEWAAVDLELEAGDAVIFGPFLIHGSDANPSNRSRRLFLQGYAAPGANRRVYPGCGLGVERSPTGAERR
jgi:Phytanoyl-CoA dioxygenase (PhyH)